jgi:pimeloyl-ACP methyl ester carboxylesterase
MRFLRFLGNLLLAVILIVISAGVLLTGYGTVISRAWENASLEDGVVGGDWATIDGEMIYYRIWEPNKGSDAVPVVLIHGLDVEGLQTWNANAQGLSQSGLRVIALDLKGLGHSARDSSPTYTLRDQANLVARLLAGLQVKTATVVGHGWGCAIALQLASTQPQLVKRLVLLAPQIYSDPLTWYRPAAKVPYLGRAVAWAMTSGEPFSRLIRQRGFYDRSALSSTYLEAIRQPTHISGTISALLAMATSPREKDPSALLASVDTPTLILLGNSDANVAPTEGERLQKALRGSRLVTVPAAGHYLHIEQSTVVNQAIVEFAVAAG